MNLNWKQIESVSNKFFVEMSFTFFTQFLEKILRRSIESGHRSNVSQYTLLEQSVSFQEGKISVQGLKHQALGMIQPFFETLDAAIYSSLFLEEETSEENNNLWESLDNPILSSLRTLFWLRNALYYDLSISSEFDSNSFLLDLELLLKQVKHLDKISFSKNKIGADPKFKIVVERLLLQLHPEPAGNSKIQPEILRWICLPKVLHTFGNTEVAQCYADPLR